MSDHLHHDPVDLLRKRKLRNTDCRVKILECFQQHNYALTQGLLEQELHAEYDRVTIYRTLKSFVDSGLIHKILDDEGGIKYALCSDDCSPSSHNHSHVHFKCEVCGQTTCLESIPVPMIALPENFEMDEVNVLISGICGQCS